MGSVCDRLRAGEKRGFIKESLHREGYDYESAEKVLSLAENRLYAKKPLGVSAPKMFLVFVGVVVLVGVLSYFVLGVLSAPVDCVGDSFCTQKIIGCVDGSYSSSFRGITTEYGIENRGAFCSVFVRVVKSDYPGVKQGMSMNCLYPIVNGNSVLGEGSSACDGSLVGVLPF